MSGLLGRERGGKVTVRVAWSEDCQRAVACFWNDEVEYVVVKGRDSNENITTVSNTFLGLSTQGFQRDFYSCLICLGV